MSFGPFLLALFEHGRVRVAGTDDPPPDEMAEAGEILARVDRQNRLELPGLPPPLSPAAALWAAVTFYRGCQFLVFREVDAQIVRQTLTRPCPEPPSPATVYSVDLAFRYLPDLLTMARASSTADPLVEELLRLGREWPLSSVGIKGLNEVDPAVLIQDPSLRQLYVDRVLARRDKSRLDDPSVRDAARGSLGLFSELAPEEIAAALK